MFAWKLNAFLGFLGHLLLRDRGSVVPVFVGLSLAFVAARGVEADGVFPTSNAWLVSYHSHVNHLTGWTALFFGAPWCAHCTEFL